MTVCNKYEKRFLMKELTKVDLLILAREKAQ